MPYHISLLIAEYSKMDAILFDPEEKKFRHEFLFPIDKDKCYEMGKRLEEKAMTLNE